MSAAIDYKKEDRFLEAFEGIETKTVARALDNLCPTMSFAKSSKSTLATMFAKGQIPATLGGIQDAVEEELEISKARAKLGGSKRATTIAIAAVRFVDWFEKEYEVSNADEIRCPYIRALYGAVRHE